MIRATLILYYLKSANYFLTVICVRIYYENAVVYPQAEFLLVVLISNKLKI